MHEELLGLSTHELLQVLLHRDEPRYIGVRGGDRHDWLTAEQEVEDDLRALASGARDAAAPAIPDAATEVPKAEVKEAFVGQLLEELEALPSEARTARLGLAGGLPRRGEAIDVGAFRELVDAWVHSLGYEDESGNDGEMPAEAEELVALYRQHRQPAATAKSPDFERQRRERGDAPVRPYGIRQTFVVGDWIEHPKFGEGRVIEAHSKIVVQFADLVRTLVHNR